MGIVEGRGRVATSDVANFLACPELTQLDLRAAWRTWTMALIVASPDLIHVSCRTPHQMTLVNTLCQAWETGG